MSSVAAAVDLELVARRRVLNVYSAITVLALVLIAVLVVYAIRLGPLVGPGVEQSFGLDLALLFLTAALLAHVVDWTYRVWPLGRSVTPPVPGAVTDRGLATAMQVLIVVLVAAAVGYLIATLLTG